MRRRRILITAILAAAAAAAGGYLYVQSRPSVTVVVVRRGQAVQAVYATGAVEPINWAKVAPTTTGRIVAILARDGQAVRRGDPLVQLDEREESARLTELEARARYWREEAERQRSLMMRGVATREAYERAQMEYLQVQAAIGAQRQRIIDLALTSPMDGIVLRQDGEVGEVVEPRQVLFWVGQPRPLRITADVDEEDIPRVRPGQSALIKADALPGQVLVGEVSEITPMGDPVSKSYRVRVALPDDTPLRIGMTTEVNIVTRDTPDALLVPAGAVRKGRVFVLEDGVARARAVETGIEGLAAIEVQSGLAEGERVIVDPPVGLEEGDRVAAEPDAASRP